MGLCHSRHHRRRCHCCHWFPSKKEQLRLSKAVCCLLHIFPPGHPCHHHQALYSLLKLLPLREQWLDSTFPLHPRCPFLPQHLQKCSQGLVCPSRNENHPL